MKLKHLATCKIGKHKIDGNAYATPTGFICDAHLKEEQKLAKEQIVESLKKEVIPFKK